MVLLLPGRSCDMNPCMHHHGYSHSMTRAYLRQSMTCLLVGLSALPSLIIGTTYVELSMGCIVPCVIVSERKPKGRDHAIVIEEDGHVLTNHRPCRRHLGIALTRNPKYRSTAPLGSPPDRSVEEETPGRTSRILTARRTHELRAFSWPAS